MVLCTNLGKNGFMVENSKWLETIPPLSVEKKKARIE